MNCSTKRSIIDRLPLPDAIREWFREWFWSALLIIVAYALTIFYVLLLVKIYSAWLE